VAIDKYIWLMEEIVTTFKANDHCMMLIATTDLISILANTMTKRHDDIKMEIKALQRNWSNLASHVAGGRVSIDDTSTSSLST
jgi:hypothetical protein